ncbi:hypothetical protein IW262DRAFT_1397502 [Armillaria fumosa]|nr:hypothetical protein IW262DRAFT_1397502 [Armillaria fumosa]
MSDTPPPPYSEKDLYEKLAESTSRDLNSEELANAQSALAKAADNPNNSGRTVKEINSLIREGVDLDSRLQEIHNLVVKAGLSSEDKAKQLRDVYIGLLWRSREVAGKALGAVKEFKGDMLELLMDPDETPQSKITDLTETWNVIKTKGVEAQKQPHEFNSLLKSLSEYSKTVQQEISAEESKEKVQIQAVHKEVTKLEVAIEELQNGVVNPLSKMLKLTKGVFKGLLSGSPMTTFDDLIEAAVNGISELGKYKDILKKKSEERFGEKMYHFQCADSPYRGRVALQHKLEAKRETLHDLEKQQAIVGNTTIVPGLVAGIRDDIAVFAKRLTTFTGVFDQLQDEYDGFVLLLKSNTPVTDPAFKSRVQLMKSLAPRIVSALELYSKAQIRET